MLDKFQPAKADPILGLGKLFQADPRDGKIDLGVGVYKDASGNTPIVRAVKQAETILHQTQTSKTYVALAGSELFRDKMRELVLADSVAVDRVASLQTPGGTGAIRQVFETMKMLNPNGTIWISNPSWPSHMAMATHMGFKTVLIRILMPLQKWSTPQRRWSRLRNCKLVIYCCCTAAVTTQQAPILIWPHGRRSPIW